ncbi:MAG: ABC transporter permease [Candidatus Hecatellaceae archaeon]
MAQSFTVKPEKGFEFKIHGHLESLLFLFPLTVILLGWELAVRLGFASSELLPSPINVFQTLAYSMVNLSFLLTVGRSLSVLGMGLLLALLTAIPLAIATGLKRRFDAALTPLIMIFGALPDLALLPIIIYWFGPTVTSALLMATIVAFFPLFFMVREGVNAIPEDYFHVVEIYSTKKAHLFTKLIFPATFSNLITGLRLSYEFLWEVVLAVEIIARIGGVGLLIDSSVKGGALNEAFAALFFIGLIAILVDRAVFQRLEDKVRRWRD